MTLPLRAGRTPNLYWNAVSTDRLRKDPQYTALPPIGDLTLDGPDSYRMVRQDSRLWDDLHQGVLTTGKLNASLGFYETRAAKRLGIGGSFVSHRPLLSAYHHLMEGVHIPTPASIAAGLKESGISPTETGNPEARQRRSRSAASRGQQAVRMCWGSAQEAATLYALMHAVPGSHLLEVGMFQVGLESLPPAWGFKKGDLPPLGASPDGMLWHPSGLCQPGDVRGNESDAAAAPPPGFEFVGPTSRLDTELDQLLQQLEATQIASRSRLREPGAQHPLSHAGWADLASRGTLEVVEVKNVSPFWAPASTSRYTISDRGPACQLLPFWVPQLQLEMLASGVGSAILVSRSATKGMSLFRVSRDDGYLQQMLATLKRFYGTYVLKRHPPPKDMFFERSDYQALITKTLSIARKAEHLAHVPSPRLDASADSRAFIE